VFFEFENIQSDQKFLKERLHRLVEQQDVAQLRRAYCILRAALES
jgi:hypothetical protein